MLGFRAFSLITLLVICLPATSPSFQGPVKKDKDMGKDKEAVFDEAAQDERILREAKLPVDGPSLLQYFRDRTYKEADPKRVAELIRQLGDPKFAVREKAYTELLQLGNSVLSVLKETAANHSDQETRDRAAELRKSIEQRADPTVQAATARLIGARKPEGAAEVLLAYLPFAADDMVIEDICKALEKVAVHNGKVEKAVVDAVQDKLTLKRAAAGAALVHAGVKEHLEAARQLLKDPIPAVRLRVALAFVQNKDKAAVQTLIDCLKDLSADKMWPAEDLLNRIAGEKGPQVSLGSDEPSRLKCFQAWNDWWKNNEKAIDLAKVDFSNAQLGFTLVVYQNRPVAGKPFKQGSTIAELDAAKNVRWKFEVSTFAVDAQVVGPDRVLIAERNNQKISERDFKGNVKWEKSVPGTVLSVQRLSNGNTFVVLPNGLYEYDHDGKQVFGMQRNNFDIFRGKKMRNGDVVFITNQGAVARLDSKTQNTVKSFNVGFLGLQYGNLEELPNGNLLIPLYQQNRVVEVDPNGKEVWSVPMVQPASAQRLPNGNTLIGCFGTGRVVEVDRMGREVSSHAVEGTLYLAKRR
jgi:hypothetical protein